MKTPTPRTDAATYPADCLGKTLVTNRDLARALETELTALTAECDQLRADCENETKWAAHYLAQSIADKARAERAEAELATERARLDSGTILLTVAGERVWHCGVDLRAAIDAGIKECTK